MSLKTRCLLCTSTIFVLTALGAWYAFEYVADSLIEQLGVRFAEKQVLYDKTRTLQPLIREIALARQMADAALLQDWAKELVNNKFPIHGHSGTAR